jgi:hypothetical protein
VTEPQALRLRGFAASLRMTLYSTLAISRNSVWMSGLRGGSSKMRWFLDYGLRPPLGMTLLEVVV